METQNENPQQIRQNGTPQFVYDPALDIETNETDTGSADVDGLLNEIGNDDPYDDNDPGNDEDDPGLNHNEDDDLSLNIDDEDDIEE